MRTLNLKLSLVGRNILYLSLPRQIILNSRLVSVSVRVRWAHKSTHAPRPFYELLRVYICFITPIVPYLCQVRLYQNGFPSYTLGSIKCSLINEIWIQLKSSPFFPCTFLVVHISLTRTWELNGHHRESPMRVEGMHTTGCCPVLLRDCHQHCYHHLNALQPLAWCLTSWLWWTWALFAALARYPLHD
jgi:hypothetical protein